MNLQTTLQVYGSGPADEGLGFAPGCEDVATIDFLPGFVLARRAELDVMTGQRTELLVALETAADALEELRRGFGTDVSSRCYPALNIARAAIDKATKATS